MANKKVVSVLSTAAIGTLIATAVGSTVFAAVDGLVVKNAAGAYLNYDLDALKASVINDALGQAGAELYKDFDAARTAGSIVSYHDNKVGFVDAAAVQKAALDAALAGTNFALDTFTESAKETVLPATVYQAAVTNGKVVAGAEVKPTSTPAATSLAVESVSAINLNQIKVVFTQEVDETSAETASNYSLGGVDLSASDKFELASDKKTLTINLDSAKAQYSKAILKVKGSVISGDSASVVTVPAFTQELSFSDVTVPTVKSVKVTGNKKLTVEFSETVKVPAGLIAAAGTKFKIDGQYLTNYGFSTAVAGNLTATAPQYANKIDLNFATAIPAGSHSLTVLAGNSTDLIDAAGFKIAEQSTSFDIVSVTDAPSVVGVEGQNNGTIYVTFDRSMDNNALTATNYQMNGTALLTNGTFKSGTNSTVVKFTGVPSIAKGANVLTILKDTVKDSYGNKLDSNNNTRISFTATEDTEKPTVVSVTAVTNTRIRVKFSEAVDNAYATNLANYKLKDSSGATVSLGFAPVQVTSDTYDITTPALTGSNYTLEIKNIVDTAATPNKIDTYTATFNGKDDQAPTVREAVQVGASPSQKVAVLFSEAMDSATISEVANYYYVDTASTTRALPSGTTVVPGADNKSVEITFPSSYVVNGAGASAEYNVSKLVIGNVKDVAGNILSNISYTTPSIVANGAGTVKPDYVADTFKLTSSTGKVTAEFELNQNITSLAISDFRVAGVAPDAGYVSGKKIILEFTNSANITTIKTAGTTATLTCVAQASTNIYGTAVNAFAAKSVYEDAIAPELVSIAVDANDPSKINVTFSEAIDQTITGLYKNDFVVESNGQVITINSVTTGLAANKLVINLATPLSTSATVKVATTVDIKDLANDGAKTANMYTPVTDDTNGTKGSISAASVAASNAAVVAADKAALTFTYNGTTETALPLTLTGVNGSTITWAETTDASNVGLLSGTPVDTLTFTRSNANDTDETYVLTATISMGGVSDTKAFTLTVKEKKAPATATISAKTLAAVGGTITVTLDEEVNAASKTAIENAIKAQVTGVASTDLAFSWAGAVLTVTNNHATIAAAFTADATVSVTDLNGNTNAALALDLQ